MEQEDKTKRVSDCEWAVDCKSTRCSVARDIKELKTQRAYLLSLDEDRLESGLTYLKIEKMSLEHTADDLRKQIEELKQKKAELESEFPDPKLRGAYELFLKVSQPESAREDSYNKGRRITAAGLMAAAYLGLQRYEISNSQNKGEQWNKK